MKTVKLKNSTIIIENGLDFTREIPDKYNKIAIITDENVFEIYKDKIENISKNIFIIPAGEKSKCINVLEEIYNYFSEINLSKSSAVVAFGGGVVGDIAAFVAATYLRGVDFINIPTTLLAQIDSSIGGKCGINLKSGKNLVGSFYQPKKVLVDISFLKTLDSRVLNEGFSEALKYKFSLDKNLKLDTLDKLIYNSIKIKTKIIKKDEFDNGKRKILNFGHTFGHAIEAHSRKLFHGEAVAIGMCMAADFGEYLGVTAKGTKQEIIKNLEKYNLPIKYNCNFSELLPYIKRDKKIKNDKLSFVFLKNIGSAIIKEIDIRKVEEYGRKIK